MVTFTSAHVSNSARVLEGDSPCRAPLQLLCEFPWAWPHSAKDTPSDANGWLFEFHYPNGSQLDPLHPSHLCMVTSPAFNSLSNIYIYIILVGFSPKGIIPYITSIKPPTGPSSHTIWGTVCLSTALSLQTEAFHLWSDIVAWSSR